MNAFMTIQVRVISAQALAQLKAIQAQSTATAAAGRKSWALAPISRWGNQVQWAGRQLMYNFTLPITLAGVAATKFALDNEKAMVRVAKVYGDGSAAFKQLSKTEIPALAKAFEALSSEFAVNQAQVINIAADWAAAGASGIALAKSVKLTLETMILGELDAADATKQLIAIQAQYGQSTTELANTIDILNMVENQTGATMKDLMSAMARTAGVARVSGIDVEHLGAMIAALTPAAGSAANAGNALKTIISRVLAPTKEAKDLMQAMGIQIDSFAWNSMKGSDRLELLAKKFNGLSDAQKVVASSIIGSRWQLNRLVTLLQAVTNENSYYNKSLQATASSVAVYRQRQKELNQVLTSNPQMLKQTWIILQNALARVIVPMLPYIIYLATKLSDLSNAFSNLSPVTQKWIIAGLIFLALLGPIARYVGAVANMIGLLGGAIHWLGASLLWLGKAPLLTLWAIIKWPAKAVASGFMLVGQSALWMGGGILKGMAAFLTAFTGTAVTKPLTFMLLAMKRVFLGGIIAIFGPAASMMSAAWLLSLQRLRIAWVAMIGGLARPLLIGLASLQRIWWGFFAAVGGAQLAFRNFMVTGFLTMQVLIRNGWIAFQRSLVVIQATAAGAIRAIQMGMLGMGRAVVGGLSRMAAVSVASVRVISLGAVSSLARLPVLIFTMWRGLWVGLLRLAPIALRALTGPIGLAIMAALGLIYAFRDKIKQAFQAIVGYFQQAGNNFAGIGVFWQKVVNAILNAFYALPKGVQNAMITVLKIVQTVALKVYEWLSYLNPFAHHSPSLVESVTKGMDVIQRQYARAANIGNIFQKAARDLAAFKRIADQLNNAQMNEQQSNVAKGMPNALPVFKALRTDLGALNTALARQSAAVKAQEAVVNRWQKALDAANAAVDAQRNKLDLLQARLQNLQDAYSAHQDALQNYANAPIAGMQAMEDQINANQLAQQKLRLEILKMEDATKPAQDMRDQLALLQGDIEKLSGKASDLRSGGAGSEILAPIQTQINALDAQRRAIAKASATGAGETPLDKANKQLEELQRQGEILDLEKSIKFDPLTQQIDKLANAQKELSFNEIVAGIKREQAAMATLKPQIDAATKAVANQETAVKKAEAARDSIQNKYDAEKAQLDKLNESYSHTEELIRNIEQALNDMGAAGADNIQKMNDKAAKHKKALEDAKKKTKADKPPNIPDVVKTFNAAAGANWPDVGGQAKIGREGGMKDQSAQILDFANQELGSMSDLFSKFDMFGPLKEKWNTIWGWLKEHVGPVVSAIGDAIGAAFRAIPNPFKGGLNLGPFQKIFSTAGKIIQDVFSAIKRVLQLFWPDLKRVWDALVKFGKDIWNKVAPELAKFGDLFGPLGKALSNIWQIAKPVVAIIGGALLAAFKLAASVISNTIGPVLDFVVGILKGLIKAIRGVAEFVIGVFAGDWKLAWQGIKDIFGGIWDAIVATLKAIPATLWGIVKGLVVGIVEFFKWLWNVLVGHSIVPDIVNGIISVFKLLISIPKWIWNNVLKPIVDFFSTLFRDVIAGLKLWWSGIVKEWQILTTLGKWVWNNVLKPVKDWFVGLWKDHVKPELATWWSKITGVWGALKNLAKWLWDNSFGKVFQFVKELWSVHIKPEILQWSVRWFNALVGLKNLAKWLWDNSFGKVFQFVRELWSLHVRPELAEWRGRFENVWHGLTNLPNWIWNNVMKPVKDKFAEGWNAVRNWFLDNRDRIINPVQGVVRQIVNAINWMIGGINKLSNLPGLKFHISPIILPPWFAQGGEMKRRRVGNGFITSGARAIVGEGKANWPEYVIPTDPTYRKRAKGLLRDAGKRLGIEVPEFASGGMVYPVGMPPSPQYWDPDDGARVKAQGGTGAWDFPVGVGTPVHAAWSGQIARIKDVGNTSYGLYMILNHAFQNISTLYAHLSRGSVTGKVGDFVKAGDVIAKSGKTGGVSGPHLHFEIDGGRVSLDNSGGGGIGSFIRDQVARLADPMFAVARGIIKNIVDWPLIVPGLIGVVDQVQDWVHGRATEADMAQASGATGPMVDLVKSLAEARYGWGHGAQWDALKTLLSHENSQWSPTAQNPHSTAYGLFQFLDSTWATVGGHKTSDPRLQTEYGLKYIANRYGNPANAWKFWQGHNWYEQGGVLPIGLARGGIIRRKAHGVLARIGEGNRDEAVVPLPRDWRKGTFGTTNNSKSEIHIHGNLEFPNIKSGEDADIFIANLKSLAGGAA